MARTSPRQRRTIGRVMQEFEHGELKSGRGGRAGKVKKRKQAIAIALHEAGASKYDTRAERKKIAAKLKRKVKVARVRRKVARARAALQKRVGMRAMGGKIATKRARVAKVVRKTVRRARVKRAIRRARGNGMGEGLL